MIVCVAESPTSVKIVGAGLSVAEVLATPSTDDVDALASVGLDFDSVVLVCCLAGVDLGESSMVEVGVPDNLPKSVLSTPSACSMEFSGIGLLIEAQPSSMGSRNCDSAFGSSLVQWKNMQTRTLSRKDPLEALHMHLGLLMPQSLNPIQLSMHCENTTDVDEDASTWPRSGSRSAVANKVVLRCFLTPIFGRLGSDVL